MGLWIFTSVIFCILFLVARSWYRAEKARANGLDKENRRLDQENLQLEMENLRLTTRIHNLSHALDVALGAMESVREEKREDRREVLRKAFVKRHTDDIERITRDIEDGMRG